MEIKNHFYTRYCQRFLDMKDVDEKELKKYVFDNKEKLTEDIIELKNNGILIWTGEIADQECSDFYLYDNIIMVASPPGSDTLITIYGLDYGFSDSTNRQIIKSLLGEISKVEKDLSKCEVKNKTIISSKTFELSEVEQQMKAMKEQLKMLEERKLCVEYDIRTAHSGISYLNLEKDKLARKLIGSINLKMILLAGKCSNGTAR